MVRGNPTQWFKTVTWALVFAYQDRAGVHFLNMLVQIVFSQKSAEKLISFDWLPQGGSQSKEQAHLPLDPPTYLLSLSLSLSSPLPPVVSHDPLNEQASCFLGGCWWSWAQGVLGALKGCHWCFFWCWPSWAQNALEQLKGCHWSLGVMLTTAGQHQNKNKLSGWGTPVLRMAWA